MIDDNIAEKIRQKKLDSLTAKHLHVKRSEQLNKRIKLVDFLALGVPAVYFAFRYTAKNTIFEWYVEFAWEILAGILVACTILKLAYQWQEQTQKHYKLLGENIGLVGQADNLLSERSNVSPESARLFFLLADKSEIEDRSILGQLPNEEKQFAYREGLKEWEPGNSSIVCPQCRSSPWNFIPGSCQLCGNTPAKERGHNEHHC